MFVIENLRSFPNNITEELPYSIFTQGNPVQVCLKTFRDFSKTFQKLKLDHKNEKYLLNDWIDLMMYLTSDIGHLTKECYKKLIIDKISKADDFIKTITHKHMVLKSKILNIINDEYMIYDSMKCMKFFSKFLQINIVVVIEEDHYIKYTDDDYKNTAIIYRKNNKYDYEVCKDYDIKKYRTYLSDLLLNELNLTEVQQYAINLNIQNAKSKKKSALIEELMTIS